MDGNEQPESCPSIWTYRLLPTAETVGESIILTLGLPQ
jgi:hypothetical protein